MKTFVLRSFAAFAALLLFLPVAGKASTVTTLLSEDFSGSAFPPSGWNANQVYPEGTYLYGSPGYWYQSSYGVDGANGSAVMWSLYGGGTWNGSNYASSEWLQTPAVDASSFQGSADSTFVDFDLWAPYNYYQYYYDMNYGWNFEFKFTVSAGSDPISTLSTTHGDYSAYTFLDYNYGASDPSSYPSSGYWRHYHVYIPSSDRTSALQILFNFDETNNTYYNYCDNFAIDNVVIQDTRLDVLTLLGPPSLDFGQIPYLQTSLPQYTRFVNNSSRTITLSNIAVGGQDPNDFTVVYAPSSIPVGVEDSIGIVYAPQAAGERGANLTFNTDADAPKSVSIPLNGFGQRPYISLPPLLTPLFSKQRVRFADTIFTSLQISNTGQIPLHVSPSSFIDGDYPQMYSIVRIPPAIPPDGTDSMIIAFSPTVEGVLAANLNIVSDAQNGTQIVPLKGIGILARLDVNNSYTNAISLNFDSVAVGTDSCFQVTLFNPGSDTLAIEKNFFSSSDYDFRLTPLTGMDTLIAPGAAGTIQVCFKPLKRGYRTAELRIVTNIPLTYDDPRLDTSQFTVLFTGTGVPTGNFLITSPDRVDTTQVGKTICQTDTLWNLGSADLTVTKLTITGPDDTEFLATPPTLPLVLAAGTHQTFTVCATPTGINDRMGMLTGIAIAGEKTDTSQLGLDVFGQSAALTAVVDSAFPASTCVGESSTGVVTVTNTGNVSAAYTATITGGTNAADFAVVPPAISPSESAGGVATFHVTFTPTTNGTETATLTIAGGPGGTVTLSAMGGAAAITGSQNVSAMVGAPPDTFNVVVNDTGTCDWTPGTPGGVVSPYTYVSGGTTSIPAGGNGTLVFTFTPTTAGTFPMTLSFSSANGEAGTSIPAANVTVNGTASASGVTPESASQGYSLEQNYPNPFGGKSDVEITLPTSGIVRLAIVNVTGKLMQTVLDQRMAAGTFEVTLDASSLASGTYYYQMTAGTVTLMRQMMVIK